MRESQPAAAAAVDVAGERVLIAARIAVSAVFFMGGAGLGVWAAYIPILKARLALDEAQIGIVLLCVAIGCICGMPAAGLIRSRLGAEPAVGVAGGAFACSVFGPSLAPSFATLALAALFVGATFGLLDVCMNAQATAIERALGRPILSSVHACFSIGNLGGALAASVLIGLDLGAAGGLGTASVAMVALTLAAMPWIRLPPSHVEPAEHMRIFQVPKPAILGIGALCAASFIMELGILDWGAVYLVQATHASPIVAAYGLAVFSLAMSAGRFSGDLVVARLGRVLTVQLSALLAAAGLAAVIVPSDPWMALPGFALTGLGIANLVPVLFSASGRLPGVAPGAGIAMAVTMAYGGGLFGPPTIGFVADMFGMRAAFGMLAFAALLIACAVRAAIPPAARR